MKNRRRWADEAGFTLIEVLVATLLMTVILGALATVTSQWLPNWNRGMARVQQAERLAIGLERIVADFSVAEMAPINADSKLAFFDGNELSATFVRTAVGPNSRPGLEIIRFSERADSQGLALTRERAPFTPMDAGASIRFSDQVVLIRSPLRVTFAYAGPDRAWQSAWREKKLLPDMVRITVRDAGSGQVLASSAATIVHVNAPPECARAKNARQCVEQASKPDSPQKEGETL